MGAGKGYFTDYPKHVGFILGNEFCERFSFYGMKAILVIFLTRALNLEDDPATEIYHGFNMACYFTPLFGALLADGYLGQYKTIFSISIIYAIGNIVMAVGSIPLAGQNYIDALPYTGLALIAIGTGGIKPCVAAFGADQFEDHQVRQKETFFSLFYMSINIGSLMSMIITPLIRSNVECFGDECYALAFGIPAILMIVSLILFVIGTRWYTIKPPGDNVIGNLFTCIFVALKGKFSCSKTEGKREHWLDYADSRFEKRFIDEVKIVMHVLFIFIPFPVFNALFDQQGSRWTLQAGRMDGDFGAFVLEPDLVQVANPLLVLVLVPFTETFIYPCLDKLKIPNTPLVRMGVGMFLAGTAFVMSGFLQIAIDETQPSHVPSGMARYKVLNAVPCDISVHVYDNNTASSLKDITIPYSSRQDVSQFEVLASNYTFDVEFTNCVGALDASYTETYMFEDRGSYNMITYWNEDAQRASLIRAAQPIQDRAVKGEAKLQFFNTWEDDTHMLVWTTGNEDPVNITYLETSPAPTVPRGNVDVRPVNETFQAITKAGAVYTGVFHYGNLNETSTSKTFTQYQDIGPNSVNILLMLPQYFVMTMGEVFFMVSGLAFAYSQAPSTMKAVLQAAWLLTSSFGNLIVMVITAAGNLPSQVAEFFMYALLMYVTIVVYGFMAWSYEYVDLDALNADDEEEVDKDDALKSDTDSIRRRRRSGTSGSSGSRRGKQGVENIAMSQDEPPPHYDEVENDPYLSIHL